MEKITKAKLYTNLEVVYLIAEAGDQLIRELMENKEDIDDDVFQVALATTIRVKSIAQEKLNVSQEELTEFVKAKEENDSI